VTSDNLDACTDLINTKLADKTWPRHDQLAGAAIHQDGKQHYLTLYMKDDVGLNDIDTAFQGSGFSVSRDKLRLFGHVVLQIDARQASTEALTSALEAMDSVSVVKSQDIKGALLVTVEMPYPVVAEGRPDPQRLGWEKFARNDYLSANTKVDAAPVTRTMLPGFNAIRDIVADQNAHLSDIRWSTSYACRALGCVTVPSVAATVATSTDRSVSGRN
jgi:hypothetical protein